MTAAKGFLLKGEGLKFNYRKEEKIKARPCGTAAFTGKMTSQCNDLTRDMGI